MPSSDVSATRCLLRRFCGVALQLCVVALVLELCARMDDSLSWNAPFWGEYSEEMLFVNDSLGYHLRPDSRFQKWRINSFGFRGPEIPIVKPRGVTRVVTLGASETFGLYEREGMEYPAQLQARLEHARPGRYQVLNAAIPGISPPRIVYYFNAWITRFRPDLVVYYPTSSFMLNAEVSAAPWKPGARADEARPRFSPRIASKLGDLYRRLAPAPFQGAVRRALIARAVGQHPPGWVMSRVPPEKAVAFRRELADLVHAVRAARAEIVLATHASRIGRLDSPEERELMVAWRKQAPDRSEQCLLEAERLANDIIRHVGQEENVRIVDVDAMLPKSPAIFADYVHFTEEGAGQVADALSPVVIEATGNAGRSLYARSPAVLGKPSSN
jgi:lysophospholipase L1-like esterase